MKLLNLKPLTAGLAACLLLSGIFANQVLAAIPSPVITSPNTKSCVVGTLCTYTITATNSPTSFGAAPIPAGMFLTGSVLSGYPTTIATTTVTVSATNAGGTGRLAVAFSVTVSPARVVVAPSGGHYTTISAAMAGINPTATNPAVIEVWPGVYTEPATVDIKSYVHLKGSGRDVTTINSGAGLQAVGKTNVTISGLTVSGVGSSVYYRDTTGTISENTVSNGSGIVIYNSTSTSVPPNSVIITKNIVLNNRYNGIEVTNVTAIVTDNVVSGNGSGGSSTGGIFIYREGSSTISGNIITGNNGEGIYICTDSTPTISNNIITDNLLVGLDFATRTSGGSVTNNKIINNGGTLHADILVRYTGTVTPNFSFNVFDDIAGDGGVGSYNVNSNGNPILVP